MTAVNLVDFLLARIAEDEAGHQRMEEAAARQGIDGREITWRAVAECEAKRRIVERHGEQEARTTEECRQTMCCEEGCLITYCTGCGTILDGSPCPDLAALALPYADHSDYDEEWAV